MGDLHSHGTRICYERVNASDDAKVFEERTMATISDLGSAKIYRFPARGRYTAAGSRDGFNSATNMSNVFTLPRAAMTACGSNWYHAEAIQEEEQSDK
jgi:hypothetical protein